MAKGNLRVPKGTKEAVRKRLKDKKLKGKVRTKTGLIIRKKTVT